MAKVIKWKKEEAKKVLMKHIEDHNEYVKKQEPIWGLSEATYKNEFYTEFNSSTQAFAAVDKEFEWSARVSGNHSFSFIRLLHSKLISNPPTIASYPLSSEMQDRDAAKAADKIARHQRKSLKIDSIDSEVALSALLYGTGIKKIGWDPDSGEIIDREGNEVTMEGNVKALAVNIRNFYCDQQADSWEEAKWCFHKIILKKEEAEYRYPKHEGLFTVGKEINSFSAKNQAKEKDKDTVVIYEYYEKARPINGMEGRFVVATKDGEILEDNKLPYSHGILPFEIFTDIDIPQQIFGKGIMEMLQDPQDTINRLLSQIVENINTHTVIRLAIPEEAGVNEDTITNKPVDIIKIQGGPQNAPIQLTPSSLPNHIFKFYDMLVNVMEHVSGVRQVSRGTAPKTLSGFAMQFLQEQDEKVLLQLHNKWKRYHVNSYRQILMLVKEFWKEDRQVALVGKNNDVEIDAFSGANLEGRFDIDYEYGTNLPSDPSAKRQAIMELIDRGLIKDEKVALRLLELGELEEVYDTSIKAKQQQKREMESLLQGEQVEIFEREDHAAHLEVLYEYINDKDYRDAIEPDIREIINEHARQHEEIVKVKLGGQGEPGQEPPPQGLPPEGGVAPEGAGGGMPPMPGGAAPL